MRKILLLSIIFSFFSCSDNIPSEEFAKEAVSETIKNETKGVVELLEFKKTDGLSELKNGVNYYKLEFSGTIQYNEDGFYFGQAYSSLDSKGFLKFVNEEPKRLYQSHKYREVQKGTTKNILGVIRFIKKEKGWKKDRVFMAFEKEKQNN